MTDKQKNYIRAKAIEQKNKERIIEAIGYSTPDTSGIYAFTRTDENGFKFAYIGQSLYIVSRMAQHLAGYEQHIDLSLRKHGLYDSEKNPKGWLPEVIMYCAPMEMNRKERYFIKKYADDGWQLRNVTGGSQGVGKTDINERKPSRGYRDGVKQGERNVIKKIAHLFNLHLKAVCKADKPSKNAIKALDKFNQILQGETDND